MELEKLHIFRMIHIDNIPHVVKFGITGKFSCNFNSNYIPIGDKRIILRRSNLKRTIGNSDINLNDFIPFNFWIKMPMLYMIQNGYNVPKLDASNIIYMAVELDKIISGDFDFVFSDGHPVNNITKFYGKKDIDNISKIIDMKAVHAEYWKDEIDLDLKRRKEAEFLVKDDIPFDFITKFGCYNDAAEMKLSNFGISQNLIGKTNTIYF